LLATEGLRDDALKTVFSIMQFFWVTQGGYINTMEKLGVAGDRGLAGWYVEDGVFNYAIFSVGV